MSLEMLTSFGWDKYAKYHLSIDTFGASGPAGVVLKKFGFTVENVVAKVKEIVK